MHTKYNLESVWGVSTSYLPDLAKVLISKILIKK